MALVRQARLRFAVWVVFLVLVAFGTAMAHLTAWQIVVVMFGAWMLVALIELAVSRLTAPTRPLPRPTLPPPPPIEVERVRVLPREPVSREPEPPPVQEPIPVEPVAAAPEPEPAPVVVAEPEPEPAPVVVAEPEPEPAPVVVAEPEPEPAREPAVATARVPLPSGPQRWNIWSLEQLAREVSGTDLARDEEWAYLLVYLRDFANPDGMLPSDFDDLVRETFGDLIGVGSGL